MDAYIYAKIKMLPYDRSKLNEEADWKLNKK